MLGLLRPLFVGTSASRRESEAKWLMRWAPLLRFGLPVCFWLFPFFLYFTFFLFFSVPFQRESGEQLRRKKGIDSSDLIFFAFAF
jgi:hypothetical protein